MNDATTIRDVIAAHPKACGHKLMRLTRKALGRQLDFADENVIWAVRPDCGMDCEDMCPVSGRPEMV